MKNKNLLYLLIGIVIGLVLGLMIGKSFAKPTVVNEVAYETTEPTALPSEEPTTTPIPEVTEEPSEAIIDEHGTYDSKEDVALYIHTYNRLPDNYMTKKEARKYGWEGGALHLVVDGMCIGGDVFTNYEEVLPEIDGTYYECDIDTLTKKKRGAKRIVFSDEGDIYYTSDHYETFEKLYGADDD